jgi:hypothetical protein
LSTKVQLAIDSSSSSREEPQSEDLLRDIRTVCESPVVGALLEAVDGGLLVLNASRRILASNIRRLWSSGPEVDPDTLLGLRPGDALACQFAASRGRACGTTEACQDCGISGAVLECQRTGNAVERECLLTVGDDLAPLELRVRAAPVTIDDREYTVVSLRDISSEKRRESLEQVFFHDLMNTVSALSGWAWTMTRPGADIDGTAPRVSRLVEHLGHEIAYQRALLEAERGTLKPERVSVDTAALLAQVQTICSYHGQARKCSLVVHNQCMGVELITDPLLLERVLVNMVKNAFEASQTGGTVRLTCEPVADNQGTDGGKKLENVRAIAFRVHNDTVMSERVRLRIFQRSFTTKAGKGRGLGTYSMKLLGERYLGGRVFFTSKVSEGTSFSMELELDPRPTPTLGPGLDSERET